VRIKDWLSRLEKDLKLIGIISDTHIPARAKAIPKKVFEVFSDVSLILHAGDLNRLSVIEELKQIAPVVAVYGNMDNREVKEKLTAITSVKIYSWDIGLTHHGGGFWGTKHLERIAAKNNFDVLVFGHTHRPFLKQGKNALFFNPGSPTEPLPPFITKRCVGLLKISKKVIEPKIIHL